MLVSPPELLHAWGGSEFSMHGCLVMIVLTICKSFFSLKYSDFDNNIEKDACIPTKTNESNIIFDAILIKIFHKKIDIPNLRPITK